MKHGWRDQITVITLITLALSFLPFLIDYTPKIPFYLSGSIQIYLVIIFSFHVIGVILYLVLAYYSRKLYKMSFNEQMIISFRRLTAFYASLSATILLLSMALFILIEYRTSNVYVIIFDKEIFVYPTLVAIASVWSTASASFYFLFAYYMFSKKDNNVILSIYLSLVIVADFLLIQKENNYGEGIEVITPVKIFSRIFLFILYAIPILLVMLRSYSNFRRIKEPVLRFRQILYLISNLLFLSFFILYLLDSFIIQPFSSIMIYAYILAFLGLVGIYLASIFPQFLERIVIKLMNTRR